MKCTHCGAQLPPNEHICEYCNLYNVLEEEKKKEEIQEVKKQEILKEKYSKKLDIWLIISFILSLIPILLIFYCLIQANGDYSEGGGGAVFWTIIIYYCTVGIPFAITALVIAFKRVRKYDSNLARLIIGLTLAPLIFFLIFFIV